MPRRGGPIRFGVFELDLAAAELRRNGAHLKLQEQPFQVLAALLERPREIVTKEELQERIWKDDTFVDFDRSLATAVNKVRQALGDSATNSRFVETVPRRGYRFIGPIPAGPGASTEPTLTAGNVPATRADGRRRLFTVRFAAPWVLLLVAIGIIVRFWIGAPEPPPPASVVKFAYAPGNNFQEPVISPDGRQIAYVAGEGERTLWIQDLAETAPRELQGTEGARGPFWSPGSDFLGFATGTHLKKVSVHDGVVVTVCELPILDFRGGTWGPDGRLIVFNGSEFGNRAAYEVSAQGGDPKPLDPEAGPKNQPHFLALSASQRVMLSTAGPFMYAKHRSAQITLHNLDTREETMLAEGRFPVYSPTDT